MNETVMHQSADMILTDAKNRLGSLEQIVTRCPSCGSQSLFIGKGGHLTCSRIDCKAPSVDQAVEDLRAELREAKDEIRAADAGLERIHACITMAQEILGLQPGRLQAAIDEVSDWVRDRALGGR
jgi:hypothetical protein